jgi:restriction system protein
MSVRDCIKGLAKEYRLTDEECAQLLPSGKQTIFANRVHWAITYMVKAALLQRTKRGHFTATERGKAVLSRNPQRIDNKVLYQFQEFGLGNDDGTHVIGHGDPSARDAMTNINSTSDTHH